MGRVAILVVTYNSAEEIGACLDAALAQGRDGLEVEVVAVDNASTDGTLAVLERHADRVRVIGRDVNDGYAAGVNAALSAAGPGDVLLLNPDVVMDAGCLAALAAHLEHEPGVAAAAALLRDPDGGLQRFARREPDLRAVAWTFTEAGRRLDVRRGEPQLRHRRYEDEWRRGLDGPLAVDCPAAACVLVRRELAGGRAFDPDLPLFFNDAELWRRLRAGGWRIDVVPSAGAVHGYGTSVRRVDPLRLRAEWVASAWRYLAPTLSMPGRAALLAIFLADAVSAWALGRSGRGRPDTHLHVRGTLGGLGLPGGVKPWLSRPALRWRRRAGR